ncbi:hypothetical protein JCM33374_g5105 [Metschnikowia sp. JCM 33374]|nr:hypothetical protein JCM33374_g5105 [Metschnikowia sp. JCM 33374]
MNRPKMNFQRNFLTPFDKILKVIPKKEALPGNKMMTHVIGDLGTDKIPPRRLIPARRRDNIKFDLDNAKEGMLESIREEIDCMNTQYGHMFPEETKRRKRASNKPRQAEQPIVVEASEGNDKPSDNTDAKSSHEKDVSSEETHSVDPEHVDEVQSEGEQSMNDGSSEDESNTNQEADPFTENNINNTFNSKTNTNEDNEQDLSRKTTETLQSSVVDSEMGTQHPHIETARKPTTPISSTQPTPMSSFDDEWMADLPNNVLPLQPPFTPVTPSPRHTGTGEQTNNSGSRRQQGIQGSPLANRNAKSTPKTSTRRLGRAMSAKTKPSPNKSAKN